jgi:hypothetical protein
MNESATPSARVDDLSTRVEHLKGPLEGPGLRGERT